MSTESIPPVRPQAPAHEMYNPIRIKPADDKAPPRRDGRRPPPRRKPSGEETAEPDIEDLGPEATGEEPPADPAPEATAPPPDSDDGQTPHLDITA